jgi:hypothetical protein
MLTQEEIAIKVRASVAFFLKIDKPSTPDEVSTFDAKKLKGRPLRDEEADNIATSIRRKMRQHKEKFQLSAVEVQNAETFVDLIVLVQRRMR